MPQNNEIRDLLSSPFRNLQEEPRFLLDSLERLDAFAASEGPPLVIFGASGSGKSTLISYWADRYTRASPATRIMEYYIGMGATVTDHYSIMRQIMSEIKDMTNHTDEIPSQPDELERAFANFLGFTLATPVIIILDGLDRLTGAALYLDWLPRSIPKNIRLILTSGLERTVVKTRERGWEELGIPSLPESERDAMVVRYLGDQDEQLSLAQIRRIVHDAKCGLPLFLRAVLEELRHDGNDETIDRVIDRALDTSGTGDLFQHVLERIEEKFTAELVCDVMSLLWASPSGLREVELEELTDVERGKISALVKRLESYLPRLSEGYLTFFHEELRRAVETRYMHEPSRQQEIYRKLAGAFQAQLQSPAFRNSRLDKEPEQISLRLAKELAHALTQSEEYQALAIALSQIPILLALWQENPTQVLLLWEELSRNGHSPEPYYLASISELRASESSLLPEALVTIYLLLRERGNLDVPAELLEDLRAWAERHNDTRRLLQAHEGLCYLRYAAGSYREAQNHAEITLRLAESLPDTSARVRACRALGNVYLRLRRFEAAKHCFDQQYQIAQAMQDRSAMSNALGNTASVLIDEERHLEAEAVCNRQIDLAESIGNRMEVVYARMNLGIIYAELRRWEDSIGILKQALDLAQSVGNRRQATIILGNLGNYMVKLGRPEEGYPMLIAALDAHREMGFPQGMTHWLESLAEMYCTAAFGTDYPPGFLVDFIDMAPGEDWRKAVRRMAWKYAEEGHRLSRELKKYDTSYASAVVLARIETAEGNKAMARERLEEALDMLTDTLRISD